MRRGLYTIVLGYLLFIGSILSLVGLVFFVIKDVIGSQPTQKGIENASTYLFAGALLFFLANLYSFYLVVKGKWTCLMSAPERHGTKWLMFASILCIFCGPALSIGSSFLDDTKEAGAKANKVSEVTALLKREANNYKKGVKGIGTVGYVKLAGNVASALSTVFFVLFLRATALCCRDFWRTRFAELYLLFSLLLACAIGAFVVNPAPLIANPQFLLAIAGGALLCMVWYFFLILSTIGGINELLETRR
jgi:hypothetical protein